MKDTSKIKESLTFDDVLLIPSYSEIMPYAVTVKTRITKKISLNIPVISAAMDTVTEARTAIAMAQEGGLGVIHKNMSIENQSIEVEKVKKYEGGMIIQPHTISPDSTGKEALEIMTSKNFTGLPVTKDKGDLLGIITMRDLRYEKNLHYKVSNLMTQKKDLVVVEAGTSQKEARSLLNKYKIEKLPVVDKKFRLQGLITMKDIEKSKEFPNASKDRNGRLLAAAAIGVGVDMLDRVKSLVDKGLDILFIDTAHAHSKKVLDSLKIIKKKFKGLEVAVGNIATAEGARALIKAGADSIKVGVGPGSICTTRIIAGIGVPQLTAILDVCSVASKNNIPVIADGGIKYSGDITKALAAGASCVMIGNLLAGTDEAPGEIVLYQGRTFKTYRGMGSIEAMKEGSKDRYYQDDIIDSKLVPEGIEGRVSYRGPINKVVFQLVGGLKAGMGYTGSKNLDSLRNAKFLKLTSAGLKESHVHDISISREAPNYSLD
ncbi:IMP dehydrogenase [bacterium]|nr:IMP dehydrogenase [bacterium]MBT4634224.1 IMP dehydrogenase [bacterium]MDG2445862.1 IMP dehydrogenase [Thermodesulfobacteriota bacterium]NSW99172.1 IMP dehydrogenase [bacterium]